MVKKKVTVGRRLDLNRSLRCQSQKQPSGLIMRFLIGMTQSCFLSLCLFCVFFFFLSFGTNHAVIFWCGQTKKVTVPNMKFLLCDSFKITENVAQQYCQC